MSDLDRTVEDLIRTQLDRGETLIGVVLANETDEGELYLLPIRTGANPDDGSLMLKLRYFVVDVEDGRGVWTGNGISMRIPDGAAGDFPVALGRQFIRAGNAANGSLDADEVDLLVTDGRTTDETDLLDRTLRELQQGVEDGEQSTALVECNSCGREGPISDMKDMGSKLGLDYYVHDGACPDDGGESA